MGEFICPFMEKSGSLRHYDRPIGIRLVPPGVEASLGGGEPGLKFLIGQFLEFTQHLAVGRIDALVGHGWTFLMLWRARCQDASMMTLSARVSAACPKVSYASRMWSSLNRCVISSFGSILFDRRLLSSIGVLTVSTRRVVMVILRSHKFSRWRSTLVPCTPMLAMTPPGATIFSQSSKVVGTPTASIAVSTPRPPVIFMIVSTALPSVLFTTAVAPNRRATSRRLLSRSIMIISAGE